MDSKTSSMPFIIGGIIVLAVVGAGAFLVMGKDVAAPKDAMMKEEGVMEKEGMKGEDGMEKGAVMEKGGDMMKSGSYEAYAPEKLARAETGDVVLFFHASWCPSCRGLSADIEGNLAAIPADLSILKVDYDTETELKKKYGVTYQHTLVQVAADGSLIKKWSGSPTLKALASEVN
jgi:thioredoxin 1